MMGGGGRSCVWAWVALLVLAPSPLSAGQEAVEIGFRGEIQPQWEVMPERSSVGGSRGEIVDAAIKVRNKSDREVVMRVLAEAGPPAAAEHLVHLGCGPTLTVILRPGETATVPVSYLVLRGMPEATRGLEVRYAVYSFEPLLPDPLRVGREIYALRCASCHGVTGRGDGPVGRLLAPPVGDLTPALLATADREILATLAAGVGPMPAFSPALGESEQRAVLRYLRSLPAGDKAGPGR